MMIDVPRRRQNGFQEELNQNKENIHYLLDRDQQKNKHYCNSWFFKMFFKLTNLSFWLMDMDILTKGQWLEGHMYLLID